MLKEELVMEAWNDMGWPARIPLLLCLVPVVAGILYAARPTARRLAVTKALSLATLAAGIGGSVFGVISLLQLMGRRSNLSNNVWPWIAVGLSERLVTSAAPLICLALAWLIVAVGATRVKEDDISTTAR
jgi:uncharacterized protein YjeT (DUF2065 family)